jgi:hypothetical protein
VSLGISPPFSGLHEKRTFSISDRDLRRIAGAPAVRHEAEDRYARSHEKGRIFKIHKDVEILEDIEIFQDSEKIR